MTLNDSVIFLKMEVLVVKLNGFLNTHHINSAALLYDKYFYKYIVVSRGVVGSKYTDELFLER